MPLLTNYRRILARPGTAAFSASGFVGRLQISMVTLGIVLLVSARTDSYALAGAISASFVIASTLAAIFQGRLIDRLGQRHVLLPAALVCTLSLSTLVWLIEVGADTPLPHLASALGGATLPAIGAAVRARWTHALDQAADRQVAFALEAVVDESVFMVGPPLATLLATTVHPAAGLITAAATGLIGTVVFTSLRGTEPPVHFHDSASGARTPMPWRALVPVGLICFAIGGLFGATEVVTVAFAEDLGNKAAAGALLAIWALGSLLAGVITGLIDWRIRPAARIRLGVIALTALMAPTPLVRSEVAMGGLLFLAGFAIAPTLIATMAFVEQNVPAGRLTEGMAVIHTALGAGLAPGAAIAGVVIDSYGPHVGYLVAVASGLTGILAAVATRGSDSVGSGRDHLDELVGSGDGHTDP